MSTGDWTVFTAGDPVVLAAKLKTASVVVADNFEIEKAGSIWYAFVVEA